MESISIGKVKLDLTFYNGEDRYCDGEVEDEILEIVKNRSSMEYPVVIEEKKSWPVLYHLSSIRENIVTWLPIDKSMKVLEIGSGCGAITGALSRMAGKVDCVDLSKKRSEINARRHEFQDNITIYVGNFEDIEPILPRDYDYVLLIGCFEYAEGYITPQNEKNPAQEFLRIINLHRKSTGKCVIAIENRYGLKYFAGCREDHLGTYFSSIEAYKAGGGVKTYSRRGLEEILEKEEIYNYSFYYPYPDYKFMKTLFSDKHLPIEGELCDNIRNFDMDRMLLFDETAAFDGLVREEQFPFFSNSFLVFIGDRPETDYVRYSNDRDRKYQISTEFQGKNVVKRALYPEGKEHINNIYHNYELLTDRYNGGKLSIVPCKLISGEEIKFPYVKGEVLTNLFDKYLWAGDTEGFFNLFKEYVERISYNNEVAVTDIDLVFSNIIVNKNKWTVIDYEWVKEKATPVKEVAYRALYCYTLENPSRIIDCFDQIVDYLDLTKYEIEGLQEDEMRFQKEITGKRKSLMELRESFGGRIFTRQELLEGKSQLLNNDLSKKIQVYTDTGRGFNEEDSFFLDYNENNSGKFELEQSIPLEANTVRVRIDPCMNSCITELKYVSINGFVLNLKDDHRVAANGKIIKCKDSILIVFDNNDPGIEIIIKDRIRSTGNLLKFGMENTIVPESTASLLQQELKKKIRL